MGHYVLILMLAGSPSVSITQQVNYLECYRHGVEALKLHGDKNDDFICVAEREWKLEHS